MPLAAYINHHSNQIYYMNRLLFIALSVLISHLSLAQQDDAFPAAKEKIKAAKIGLFTNRLNLSTEQASQFWPVYNEYEGKKGELRSNMRKYNAETRNLTISDDRILSDLKELINIRQKEVDLEREYQGKFLKVISARQVAELYKSEQLFNQMLLKRLSRRENNNKK